MTREGALLVMVGAAALMVALIAWGWHRRKRRDSGLSAPLDVPADASLIASFPGLYVATTRHGAPLDRLAIRHLAYRSRVRVDVTDRGIGIAATGEPVVFLPRDALISTGRVTWTIDRVSEPGGLVCVTWRVADGVDAESAFRFQDVDPQAFLDAVISILPAPDTAPASTSASTENKS